MFRSQAQYIMMGERPIKSFFEKYKNQKENKPILGLKNSSGVEVNDQGMIRIVEEYYTNLFKPKETNQSVVNLFLNNIQAVECEDQMRNLIKETFLNARNLGCCYQF